MPDPSPQTTCEICGTATNTSFGFGSKIHYYCEKHKNELFKKVTGREPKPKPEPKR